jgi:hypothetical protein
MLQVQIEYSGSQHANNNNMVTEKLLEQKKYTGTNEN